VGAKRQPNAAEPYVPVEICRPCQLGDRDPTSASPTTARRTHRPTRGRRCALASSEVHRRCRWAWARFRWALQSAGWDLPLASAGHQMSRHAVRLAAASGIGVVARRRIPQSSDAVHRPPHRPVGRAPDDASRGAGDAVAADRNHRTSEAAQRSETPRRPGCPSRSAPAPTAPPAGQPGEKAGERGWQPCHFTPCSADVRSSCRRSSFCIALAGAANHGTPSVPACGGAACTRGSPGPFQLPVPPQPLRSPPRTRVPQRPAQDPASR
jgi:hypothetical protein